MGAGLLAINLGAGSGYQPLDPSRDSGEHRRGMWKAALGAAGTFWADLRDVSAAPSPKLKAASYQKYASGALVVIAGAATFLDSATKVTTAIAGPFGCLLPLLLVCFGLVWAVNAIRAKQALPATAGFVRPAGPSLVFRYGRSTRWLAKISIVLLAMVIPKNVVAIHNQFARLPLTFYGYLKDAHTGQPIVGASVRVFTEAGVDITHRYWASDNDGFYVIKTTEPAKRADRLVIAVPDCAVSVTQSLRSEYDSWPRKPAADSFREERPHVFTHSLQCGKAK